MVFILCTLPNAHGKVIQYNENPVVDVPADDEACYNKDLKESRNFAAQAQGNKKSGVKTGRRVGLIAGVVLDSSDAGFVVRKCLDGRGWNVLDYDGQKG